MPFMGYSTYYRIVGEPSVRPPLLLLHGGPGSTHNYFEVLDRVAGETGQARVAHRAVDKPPRAAAVGVVAFDPVAEAGHGA